MDTCVIIVDNSNVWIEGMKFSAKLKGITESQVEGKEPCDYSWRIDFGKLLSQVADGKTIKNTILVGSRPPKNDSLWASAEKQGFKVLVYDRNCLGKEKAVDSEIVAQGTKIVCRNPPAVLILLSGDSDFLPMINIASEMGWETEVWSFASALQSAGSLAQSATRVKLFDDVFKKIGYNQPRKK